MKNASAILKGFPLTLGAMVIVLASAPALSAEKKSWKDETMLVSKQGDLRLRCDRRPDHWRAFARDDRQRRQRRQDPEPRWRRSAPSIDNPCDSRKPAMGLARSSTSHGHMEGVHHERRYRQRCQTHDHAVEDSCRLAQNQCDCKYRGLIEQRHQGNVFQANRSQTVEDDLIGDQSNDQAK